MTKNTRKRNWIADTGKAGLAAGFLALAACSDTQPAPGEERPDPVPTLPIEDQRTQDNPRTITQREIPMPGITEADLRACEARSHLIQMERFMGLTENRERAVYWTSVNTFSVSPRVVAEKIRSAIDNNPEGDVAGCAQDAQAWRALEDAGQVRTIRSAGRTPTPR